MSKRDQTTGLKLTDVERPNVIMYNVPRDTFNTSINDHMLLDYVGRVISPCRWEALRVRGIRFDFFPTALDPVLLDFKYDQQDKDAPKSLFGPSSLT